MWEETIWMSRTSFKACGDRGRWKAAASIVLSKKPLMDMSSCMAKEKAWGVRIVIHHCPKHPSKTALLCRTPPAPKIPILHIFK